MPRLPNFVFISKNAANEKREDTMRLVKNIALALAATAAFTTAVLTGTAAHADDTVPCTQPPTVCADGGNWEK